MAEPRLFSQSHGLCSSITFLTVVEPFVAFTNVLDQVEIAEDLADQVVNEAGSEDEENKSPVISHPGNMNMVSSVGWLGLDGLM